MSLHDHSSIGITIETSDFDCLHRELPVACTLACRKWTMTKNRFSQLVISRQSWRKIIQRCKNCPRHASMSSSLLCCAFCSRTSRPSWPRAVAPFFRTKDPRVALRTDKFFNRALHKLAGVQDKDLSAYLNRKATAWYRRFPPFHSPDHINDTKKARDAEGPEEEDAGDAEDADVTVSRPMLSDDEDEDESDGGGEE